jgi:hypothetical protein
MWSWLPLLIPVALLIGLIVLVRILAPFALAAAMRRRARLQALAEELGMEYAASDDTVGLRFWFLNLLMVRGSGTAYNLLSGRFEGHKVTAFDYPRRRLMGCVVLEHAKPLPELRIFPEEIYRELTWPLDPEHIDLESEEFSRAFRVVATDRKFAYAVCNPRVMEYLLAHRDMSIEIDGRCIALSFPHLLEAREIPERLRQLVEIRSLLPDYLFVTLPEERV